MPKRLFDQAMEEGGEVTELHHRAVDDNYIVHLTMPDGKVHNFSNINPEHLKQYVDIDEETEKGVGKLGESGRVEHVVPPEKLGGGLAQRQGGGEQGQETQSVLEGPEGILGMIIGSITRYVGTDNRNSPRLQKPPAVRRAIPL